MAPLGEQSHCCEDGAAVLRDAQQMAVPARAVTTHKRQEHRDTGSRLWRQVRGQEKDLDTGSVIPPGGSPHEPPEVVPGALSTVSRLQTHPQLWAPLVAKLAKIVGLVESRLVFVFQHQLSLTSGLHWFTRS